MGAQIQTYHAMTRTLNGTTKTFNNFSGPFADFDTGTLTGPAHDDSVLVAAGATVPLWDYSTSSFKDWSVGFVGVVGAPTGMVYLGWENDTATSATDNTPTGAAVTWDKCKLYGKAVHNFTTREALTNATPDKHAKANAGGPNAWVSGQAEVDGYIYKVWVKNPTATDFRVRSVFIG